MIRWTALLQRSKKETSHSPTASCIGTHCYSYRNISLFFMTCISLLYYYSLLLFVETYEHDKPTRVATFRVRKSGTISSLDVGIVRESDRFPTRNISIRNNFGLSHVSTMRFEACVEGDKDMKRSQITTLQIQSPKTYSIIAVSALDK